MRNIGHVLLLVISIMLIRSNGETYSEFTNRIYVENKWNLDRSAATICWIVNGKLEMVDTKNPDHGFSCDVELDAPTTDKKHAEDLCTSIFPHYIVEAESRGGKTLCKFIIMFRCLDNYFSIYDKCYIVFDTPQSLQDAQRLCATVQGNKTDARLAVFTSSSLAVDLVHLEMRSVWMNVIDLGEHFANQEDEGGAVFVVRNSWKLGGKEGALEADDPNAHHSPLCEYSPKKTMAYLKWMAGKYMDVFPLTVTTAGFSISPDVYVGRSSPGEVGQFNTSINLALGFDSNIDFNRAFSSKFCPAGWFRYERDNGQVMCHQVFQGTMESCQSYGAHLTGFDSKEEVDAVLRHFRLPNKHINIGSESPCNQVGCSERPKNLRFGGIHLQRKIEKYNFGWTNGVATNLEVLYNEMWDMQMIPKPGDSAILVTLNSTWDPPLWHFHAHPISSYGTHICGKYADFLLPLTSSALPGL